MPCEDDPDGKPSLVQGIAPAALNLGVELLKAAKDNEDTAAAGAELGKAAHTIAKTVNVVLLPLAAINFGFEKARQYFSGPFTTDLSARLAGIDSAQLIAPKPSIAGPALQGLAFSHDELPLRDMYLALLASAMRKDSFKQAHPAFVEIIKQLSAEEASLLGAAMPSNVTDGKPIVELRLRREQSTGWQLLERHLSHFHNKGVPDENPRVPTMVDNWIRLGLIDVEYQAWIDDHRAYDWVVHRPEFKRHTATHSGAGATVFFQKGILRATAFGCAFGRAVGLWCNETSPEMER